MMKLILVLVGILALIGDSHGARRCPCSWCGNNKANCANHRYTVVPGLFPEEITVINMQYNQIKTIKSDDFGELKELVLLRLDQNQINEIRLKCRS